MRIQALCIAFTLCLTPLAASAGEGCTGAKSAYDVVLDLFESADEDQDGSLTQAEYEGAGLQGYGVTFEESDLDGDGATSMQEYLDLYEMHHPASGGTEA